MVQMWNRWFPECLPNWLLAFGLLDRPTARRLRLAQLEICLESWKADDMRKVALLMSIALMTAGVFAADDAPAAAVVEGDGTVYVNGQQVKFGNSDGIRSMAILLGDVVETKADGAARVNRPGLTATAGASSLVRFQTGGLALDRGTITVGTGNAFSVFARDFKVTPVSSSWTQFNVSRSTGGIQILALKNDVTVSCGTSKPVTVKESQQLSRADAPDCGLAAERGGAPAAAQGPVLASPAAQKIALAVGGGLTAWAIFQADGPVSSDVA